MTKLVFKLAVLLVHSSTVCQMLKIFSLIYIVNLSSYFILLDYYQAWQHEKQEFMTPQMHLSLSFAANFE